MNAGSGRARRRVTPTFSAFEREAKKHGFFGQFVTIDRDDFYVTCRWSPGEAAPRWAVDDIRTPVSQVAALLENAALDEVTA